MNELVNRALVGGLLRAQVDRRGLGGFHHARRMRRVRRAGQHVKFRRILASSLANETDLVPIGTIGAVQLVEREGLAVGDHLACPADVDGAEFAAFEKKRAAGFLVIGQFHGACRRHHAGDEQAVEVGELAGDFARHKQIGDLEGVAQFLRGHADQVLRTRRAADGIFKHSVVWQKGRRSTSRCQ